MPTPPILRAAAAFVHGLFRSRLSMQVEILALRHQLAVYQRTSARPTPVATLERLHGLARSAGLHFVYLGNLPGHAAESTYCPGCGRRVIERYGYTIGRLDLRGGCCAGCGRAIPGIWS